MIHFILFLLACGEKTTINDDTTTIEDSGNNTEDSGNTSTTDSGTETSDPTTTDADADGVFAYEDCDDMNPWISTGCDRTCTGDFTIEVAEDLALVAGCQTIEGNLNIDGISQSNLFALHSLQSISGNLWFFRINGIETMNGLNNLQSIGDGLIISYSDTLLSLEGLDSLHTVAGSLSITSNPSLTDISNIASLRTVGGSMLLDRLGIQSLDGFSNLETIGASIYISECPAITSLIGITTNLQSFGEDESIGTYDPDYGTIESLLYVYNNSTLCESEIEQTTIAMKDMGWLGRTVSFNNGTCD